MKMNEDHYKDNTKKNKQKNPGKNINLTREHQIVIGLNKLLFVEIEYSI